MCCVPWQDVAHVPLSSPCLHAQLVEGAEISPPPPRPTYPGNKDSVSRPQLAPIRLRPQLQSFYVQDCAACSTYLTTCSLPLTTSLAINNIIRAI